MPTTTTLPRAAALAPRPAFDPKWLIIGLCVAVSVYLGIVPLATGLVGWCPPYALFGFSTCKEFK